MAGGGFKCGRGKADEIQPGHRAGDGSKPAGKRHVEVKCSRLMPVNMTCQHRNKPGQERQQGRAGGNRNRQTNRPLHAAEVDCREKQHQHRGKQGNGNPWQIPRMNGGCREKRGQTARRNPPPPIAGSGQVRQHRADGPKRLPHSTRQCHRRGWETSESILSTRKLLPNSATGQR